MKEKIMIISINQCFKLIKVSEKKYLKNILKIFSQNIDE